MFFSQQKKKVCIALFSTAFNEDNLLSKFWGRESVQNVSCERHRDGHPL